MSKVSFSKSETIIDPATPTPVDGVVVESITNIGPTPETVTATSTAVVVAEIPSVPAPRATGSPVGYDDTDIGFEDVVLPRLNLVHKVGGLSEVFASGEIVLKQSLVVYTPKKGDKPGDPPVNLIVLGFKKTQFAEKVAGGAMGILAHTEADVAKHGGTLDYKEWEASVGAQTRGEGKALRYFQRLATAILLVEKPASFVDTDKVEFSYECEGRFYALALWSMKGTAYTHAAKGVFFTDRKLGATRSIFNAERQVIGGGYNTFQYSLSTKVETFGSNPTVVPVVKIAGKTTPSFRQFAREIIGLN